MEFNFDLSEYSFSDLLNLFKINELNSSTLKSAYKLTLYTHPDKSGLDKMYFIFFSKAFKLLNKVYNIANKKDSFKANNFNIPLDQIENILTQENFSDIFNTMFDKLNYADEEQSFGYGDWIKSSKIEKHEKVNNIEKMHSNIEEKKRELAIIDTQDNVHTINNTGYSITRQKLDNYDSTIFSKLPYQDFKRACTQTLIPVSSSNISSYNQNVHEYKKKREILKTQYIDNSESYMNRKRNAETQENLEQVYKLAQQFENEKSNQELWWSHMKQIKNDI